MKFARITVTALACATLGALCAWTALPAAAQSTMPFAVVPNPPPPLPDLVTDAREAWRTRDRSRLAAMRQVAFDQQHRSRPGSTTGS